MSEEIGKKKRVVVESLGWLTESSIMPKKHRAIAGVGPSSILELKAQLYKSQEEAKSNNSNKNPDQLEVHRAKKKITPHDPFAGRNSGVDARSHRVVKSKRSTKAQRVSELKARSAGFLEAKRTILKKVKKIYVVMDKLEMKAVKDGSASYAALEKKAELYEKLAKGELSDEEEREKYCVDFFSKSLVKETKHEGRDIFTADITEHESNTDNEPLFPDTRATGLGRAAGTIDNDEHKRFVREVHEEVNQAREKVSELKVRRQEQVAVRREKLKQAYLRKQFEKLKAKSQEGDNT